MYEKDRVISTRLLCLLTWELPVSIIQAIVAFSPEDVYIMIKIDNRPVKGVLDVWICFVNSAGILPQVKEFWSRCNSADGFASLKRSLGEK